MKRVINLATGEEVEFEDSLTPEYCVRYCWCEQHKRLSELFGLLQRGELDELARRFPVCDGEISVSYRDWACMKHVGKEEVREWLDKQKAKVTRPLGDTFSIPSGQILMVVAKRGCSGCFYASGDGSRCMNNRNDVTGRCSILRDDENGVIFMDTGKMTYSALRDLYAEKQAELDDTTARLNAELEALDKLIREMDGGEIVERENEHLLNGGETHETRD